MLLGDIVRRNGRRFPEKTALVTETIELTYKELNQRINQLAHVFQKKGLTWNSKIAILSQNVHVYSELFLRRQNAAWYQCR